jgi:hypothetical protein
MHHAAGPPSTLPLLIPQARARSWELLGNEIANCATEEIVFDNAGDARETQPATSEGKQGRFVACREGPHAKPFIQVLAL